MRSRLGVVLGSACLGLLISASLSSGAVRFVKSDAAGDANGSSWADAHTGLSAAIESASPGDELWIAAGVYLPEQLLGSLGGQGGERRRTFLISYKPLALYGGFAGTETERSQRDWVANPTVLSGDLGVPDDPSDNAMSVLTVYGVSDFVDPREGNTPGSLELDGLVIRDGRADLQGNEYAGGRPEYTGGGAYLNGSIVTFANCVFTENYAISGGGIHCHVGTLNLLNCQFIANNAFYHGGGTSASATDVSISHCAYASNTAGSTGAALRTSGGVGGSTFHTALTNSAFGGNGGAAALSIGTDTSLVTGNVLQQNYPNGSDNMVGPSPFVSSPENLRLRAGNIGIGLGSAAGIFNDITDMDGDGDAGEPLPLSFDGLPRPLDSPDSGPYQFVNLPPTALTLGASTITENRSIGTLIGSFTTEDPNLGNFDYQLVTGDGDGGNRSFRIAGNRLETAVEFDFETQSEHSIRVRSTDITDELGQSLEAVFTITVIDAIDQHVTIEALQPIAYEPRGGIVAGNPHVGKVRVSRSGEIASALSVPLSIDSSASPADNEFLIVPEPPAMLEFAPGETAFEFEVIPLFDEEDPERIIDGNEPPDVVTFQLNSRPLEYVLVESNAHVTIADGPAEAWFAQRGFTGSGIPRGDLDGNGAPDLIEYLTKDPSPPIFGLDGNSNPALTFAIDRSVRDVTFSPQLSHDLRTWVDHDRFEILETTPERQTIRISAIAVGAPRQFLRLEARVLDRPADFSASLLSVPIPMVGIPAGMFVMGGSASDEGPPTNVQVTQPFWMSFTEIQQWKFSALMDFNPSSNIGDERPVENVTAVEAMAFCDRLNAEAPLPEGYVYRLPTEAEWEYACGSDSAGNPFVPAQNDLGAYAWFSANSFFTTHDVGRKLATPWGLHDMLGNVSEWCLDGYTANYPGGIASDPFVPNEGAEFQVIRGGHIFQDAEHQRRSIRQHSEPDTRSPLIGFRIVLGVDLNPQ